MNDDYKLHPRRERLRARRDAKTHARFFDRERHFAGLTQDQRQAAQAAKVLAEKSNTAARDAALWNEPKPPPPVRSHVHSRNFEAKHQRRDKTKMTNDELRQRAIDEALRVYSEIKHSRPYALNEKSALKLAAIMRATLDRRIQTNKSPSERPNAQEEFVELIGRLDEAGCNVLQLRPAQPRKLPTPWRNPITGEALPLPTTVDEKGVLAARDPQLLALLENLQERPYRTVAQLLDEQAEQKTDEAFSYDATSHENNVFRFENKTAQAEFVRHNPLGLVRKFQYEAKDIDIPLWGKTRNPDLLGKVAWAWRDTCRPDLITLD